MRTILIVEDDEADQFLHEVVIRRARPDVEIVKAFDGREALDLLAKIGTPPDLILLDINMPRLGGHDFLAEYVEQYHDEIPVIAVLTTSDQAADRERTMKYAVVKDYIVKPIRMPDVVKLDQCVRAIKSGV